MEKTGIHILRQFYASIIFLLAVALLSSCNNTLLDDSGADSRNMETRVMEGESAAANCINAIGASLLSAGYSIQQVAIIQKAAEQEILARNLAGSSDLTLVFPAAVKGAELAVATAESGITTTSDRLTAIDAIVEGSISALDGLAAEDSQSSLADIGTAQMTASAATCSCTYADVLDPLAETVISNLDEAGLPVSDISTCVKSVIQGFSRSLIRSRASSSTKGKAMKAVTTAAVGSCENTGIADSEFSNTVNAILEGAFRGIMEGGMTDADTADMADDLTEAAVKGLGRTSIKRADYGSRIDDIISGVETGMTASGLSADKIKTMLIQIEQAALDGRINLVQKNEHVLSTSPENGARKVRIDSSIRVTFRDEMDGTSIDSTTFRMDGLQKNLSGTISYDAGTRTATFVPQLPMTSNTTHFVSLSRDIRLAGGVKWSDGYAFGFQTAPDMLNLGSYHGCLLSRSGSLRCWGDNGNGELGQENTAYMGDDETIENLAPVNVGTGRTVTGFSAGDTFTCAILDNGTLKCWGKNAYAQLGLGDLVDRGDTLSSMGDNLPAVDLGTDRTAIQVSAGSWFACALLDNFEVKCWGHGRYGRRGSGDELIRGDEAGEMGDSLAPVDLGTGRIPIQISAGKYHACVLFKDGSVKCWGKNGKGQLGLGDTEYRGDGPGEMGDNLPTIDLGTGRTAVEIAAGNYHNCARLDNNTVKCWGYNSNGQLGQGDLESRGDNAGEMGDNLPAIDLGTGRTAAGISVGASHSCARLDNNTVKCWGGYLNGRLGFPATAYVGDNPGEMGDNLPVLDLGAGRTVLEIATGSQHNCARLDNDTIRCWGYNYYGQLGLGDKEPRGDDAGEMGDNLPAVNIKLD